MSVAIHFRVERLAWAAGLFEGKGTVVTSGRLRLAVKTADEEVARRFADAVEAGKVYGPYGPYPGKPNVEPFFYWCADGEAACAVAVLLLPWLGPGCRARLDEVLSEGWADARVA